MHIHTLNQQMLVMIEKNRLHDSICWVVMAIGIAGMAAVPASDLPIYSIVIPILIFLGATVAWRFAGNPLVVVVDRRAGELTIKIPPSFGGKYENNKYMLARVVSVELVEASQSGAVKRGEALPQTYAIFIRMKDGKVVPVCHYSHKYNLRLEARNALMDVVNVYKHENQPKKKVEE